MIVGVDIGGSGVRAASVRDGLVGPLRRQSWQEPDVDALVDGVATLVRPLGPTAVGVGVPGFVHDGVVRASPHLPALRDTPLAARLAERLGVPVVVDNDANCAALGAWLRHGQPDHLVAITLGTGVGSGLIVNGQLVRGAGGTAGELGHLPVGGSRRCACGAIGCLETLVGTAGLREAAAERGIDVLDGHGIVVAARAGEPWATGVLQDAGAALGQALATVVNLLDPSHVVLLGGLSAARDLMEPSAMRVLRDHAVADALSDVTVLWEGPAEAHAILGAAHLAVRR